MLFGEAGFPIRRVIRLASRHRRGLLLALIQHDVWEMRDCAWFIGPLDCLARDVGLELERLFGRGFARRSKIGVIVSGMIDECVFRMGGIYFYVGTAPTVTNGEMCLDEKEGRV